MIEADKHCRRQALRYTLLKHFSLSFPKTRNLCCP